MVANGLGVSAVPVLCARQMEELGTVVLELEDPIIERKVGILWRTEQEWSVATRALYHVLRDSFREPTLST